MSALTPAVSNERQSCGQLVHRNLLIREDQIKELMSDPNSEDYFDDPALSIDTTKLTKVCLSYGGPADYLEIEHADGEIIRLGYRYSDWFDTAVTYLQDDSPLWQYAQNIVECVE